MNKQILAIGDKFKTSPLKKGKTYVVINVFEEFGDWYVTAYEENHPSRIQNYGLKDTTFYEVGHITHNEKILNKCKGLRFFDYDIDESRIKIDLINFYLVIEKYDDEFDLMIEEKK